jgi:aspartyl protease family protein
MGQLDQKLPAGKSINRPAAVCYWSGGHSRAEKGEALAESNNPWSHPPRPSRVRFWIWLGLLAAIGVSLLGLSSLFPGALGSSLDQAYFIQLLGFLVLVSTAVVYSRQIRVGEAIRNVVLWCAVIAVLVLGYVYRNELADAGSRIRSELIPAYAVNSGTHVISLAASEDGGYHIMGTVNGARVEFLVDTGASDIVLSPADAARAGIDVKTLDFSRQYETAHGVGNGASTHVKSLTAGPIMLSDIDVSVNQTGMRDSLLGMAFLRRLDAFSVERNRIVLRWKN